MDTNIATDERYDDQVNEDITRFLSMSLDEQNVIYTKAYSLWKRTVEWGFATGCCGELNGLVLLPELDERIPDAITIFNKIVAAPRVLVITYSNPQGNNLQSVVDPLTGNPVIDPLTRTYKTVRSPNVPLPGEIMEESFRQSPLYSFLMELCLIVYPDIHLPKTSGIIKDDDEDIFLYPELDKKMYELLWRSWARKQGNKIPEPLLREVMNLIGGHIYHPLFNKYRMPKIVEDFSQDFVLVNTSTISPEKWLLNETLSSNENKRSVPIQTHPFDWKGTVIEAYSSGVVTGYAYGSVDLDASFYSFHYKIGAHVHLTATLSEIVAMIVARNGEMHPPPMEIPVTLESFLVSAFEEPMGNGPSGAHAWGQSSVEILKQNGYTEASQLKGLTQSLLIQMGIKGRPAGIIAEAAHHL